ncbi:MAG TPA: hypothetical protein VHF05_03235 [Candidatus Paceibacterota bacterium]|nr:hypothetical protein [Candidatus Paceibacterota bacterium]
MRKRLLNSHDPALHHLAPDQLMIDDNAYRVHVNELLSKSASLFIHTMPVVLQEPKYVLEDHENRDISSYIMLVKLPIVAGSADTVIHRIKIRSARRYIAQQMHDMLVQEFLRIGGQMWPGEVERFIQKHRLDNILVLLENPPPQEPAPLQAAEVL